jgi:parallel beta-helix repeat protein
MATSNLFGGNMHANRTLLAAALRTLLCGVVTLVVGTPAFADTSGTLYVSTNTSLSENHAGSIVVAANGVTLDCKGHTISGDSVLFIGILLDGRTGVTVSNCHITGFSRGVVLNLASANVLSGNTAHHNDFGFALAFASANQLVGNTANNNTFAGFAPGTSTGNIFASNTANLNGRNGFEIHLGSDSNILTDNTANGNAADGIALAESSHNQLRGNTANGNAVDGFSLRSSSTQNVLEENVANRNGFAGFDLRDSSSNILRDNTAKNNYVGFYFGSSSLNTVQRNDACPNRAVDAVQDGSSTGNVFEENRFCVTEGF